METMIRKQINLVNAALSSTLDLYRIWAKKNGLNYNALVILYTLDSQEDCTQKQICDSWALPKQTVHGILQDFEKKGYITSSLNSQNKRERIITFTEPGAAYAASVLQKLYEMEERAMEHLGEELCLRMVECSTAYFQFLKEEIENG